MMKRKVKLLESHTTKLALQKAEVTLEDLVN